MKSRQLAGLSILIIIFLAIITTISHAQTDPQPKPPNNDLLIVIDPPKDMIDGVRQPDISLEKSENLLAPMSLMGGEPSDSCNDATPLIVFPAEPADGGVADVTDATVDEADPVLDCIWGNPTRDQGYRTVWYALLALTNGRVTISTFGSNYDTILSVHRGECELLETLQCNDDSNLFSSEITFPITEGELYFIEVADRTGSQANPAIMQLSALLEPVDSQWDMVLTTPNPPPISRHAVVSQGPDLYVVGGQSGETGLPNISNRLLRFNTDTMRWTELANIPGAGYSNTTAALASNHIYVPSGYNGDQLGYDGLHWSYSIADNSWSTVAGIPSWLLPHGVPFAWASAAVPTAQNRYYLTGGLSSAAGDVPPFIPGDKVNRTTFVYLIESNSWLRLDPMQAGRYAHTSTWIETNNLGICVAGGLGIQEDPDSGQIFTILHRSAECYQPGGNWRFIGDMNIPRFGAGSAIGPDGRWYIFGGMTTVGSFLIPVRQTEVYDPVRNTWTVLDVSYNLGDPQIMPARFWPRGAVIGNNLWTVGGSAFNDGEEALPVMERLPIPSNRSFIPVLSGNYADGTRPDDNFEQARSIAFSIPQTRNFDQQRDFFDVFTFEINASRNIRVYLDVPKDNNFDLAVYGRNKTIWGDSVNPLNGDDEEVILNNLPPNRYYVVVSRVFPTGKPDTSAYYTITVE